MHNTISLFLWLATAALAVGSEQLPVETTWIGNSLPGRPQWIPHNVEDIFVTPGGTIFTNVRWEEGGGNVQAFDRDGNLIANADVGNWGGGPVVTANDRYLYFAAATKRKIRGVPPEATGIERRDLADITDMTARRFAVTAAERKKNLVTGLAASASRVYAAIAELDEVRVLDSELELLGTWKVESPGQMALDEEGNLWIARQNTGTAHRFTPQGKRLAQFISLPEAGVIGDLAFDSTGLLYISDIGPAEQIHVYADTTIRPVPQRVIGVKGGALSDPAGRHGPNRFLHVTGLGLDAAGNLVVANRPNVSGSTLLQSYAPDGSLNWERMCLVWIDAPGFDPETPDTLYTGCESFSLDMSKPRGRQWTFTAHTLDRHRYPDDPRLRFKPGATWMRRIAGRLIQYNVPMNGNAVSFYRFDREQAGHIAIPAGYVTAEQAWTDTSGDGRQQAEEQFTFETRNIGRGWWVEPSGTIWRATEKNGILRYRLTGFTADGVPRYEFEKPGRFAMPEPFQKLRRIRFYPERGDLMVLSGFTEGHPDTKQHWKRCGPVFRFYSGWKAGQWNLLREIVPPYETERKGPHGDGNVQSFDLVDDYFFVARCGRSHTDALGVGLGHVEIYDLTTGNQIGWIEPPEDFGPVGLLDMTESMSVRKTADGAYRIWLEDDHYGKIYAYTWKP